MLVRCWGARGSIPVSGREYLRYGGDTPCIEIRTQDDDIVIIDAGSGIRRLGNRLIDEKRHDYTMFFTHAHWDHIMGFPFFKPIYRPETQIALFGCPFAQASVKEIISRIMAPPNFPVNFDDITADIRYQEACQETFAIGGLTVTPIPISHPNQGMGYRFEEEGKSFVFLTDNELTYRHPGGLAYEDYCVLRKRGGPPHPRCRIPPRGLPPDPDLGPFRLYRRPRLALDAGVARLGLFHHNQERTDGTWMRWWRMPEDRRRPPAECFAMHQDMEIVL